MLQVVYGKYFGQSKVCECMGNSLVRVWYVSSFTLCWLSLLDGLLGFKGFIGNR